MRLHKDRPVQAAGLLRLGCYRIDCGSLTLDAGLAMVTQGMAWWYRTTLGSSLPWIRGQYEFAKQESVARIVRTVARRLSAHRKITSARPSSVYGGNRP